VYGIIIIQATLLNDIFNLHF